MKKKKVNKIMILLVAVLAVFVAGLVIVNNQMSKAASSVNTVKTVEVKTGDVKEELDATGTVKSLNTKVFFSPVNATVKEASFQVGDIVKAGTQLVTYNLEDLEKENQKAELNVKSGQYDYSDTVNQANKAAAKQAQAAANANTLQSQVDEWQQYVYDLQAAIEQANRDAQADAAADVAAAASQAQAEYLKQEKELAKARDKALVSYNEAKTQYDMAMERWKQSASAADEQALKAQTEKLSKAQVAYETAESRYTQLIENGAGSGAADFSGVTADTTALQRELNEAQTTLAELQSDLASEKAIAESDPQEVSDETLEKLKIANNLSELEAKSVEELIEEGKKGIRAEFTGVISDSKIVQGTTVSQGMEMFTLESTEKVSVDISVSKYDYTLLKEGQKAEIEMGDNTYQGTVTKINHVAVANEKGTPMIGAVVTVDNPDENIFIGVDAKVRVQAAEASQVPILPVEAVNIGSSGSFCYVLRDGVIEKQDIETGISSDTHVEIRKGLAAGDLVIPDIGDLEEGMAAESAGEDEV